MTSRQLTPAPEFGGWGTPPRTPRRLAPRRPRALVALVASVVCLAGATGVALSASNHGAPTSRGTGARTSDPTRTMVHAISSVLAASAADRSRVITAIDGVQACTLAASQGQTVVEAVIEARRGAVAQLERLSAAAPAGMTAPVVADLITTLNASISDDMSYMSWMVDIGGGRAACGADPMTDPNFAAAKAESDRTNVDKRTFVEAWNPLAAEYGEPTYQAEDF